MAITHTKVSGVADSGDADLVQSTDWNASHTVTTITATDITADSIGFGGSTMTAYDEGTFTPTLTWGTPGDEVIAYTTQSGIYTRIGDFVHASVYLVTSTFTHTTAAGNLLISSLPFTAVSGPTYRYAGACLAGGHNLTTEQGFAVWPHGTDAYIARITNAGAVGATTTAHWPTGNTVTLYAQFTYRTS
jgi:hypothetical protein